jgi:glycerophosphoryl diester phosphodiesterase
VHHDAELGGYANELSGVPIADLTWNRLSAVRLARDIGVPTLGDVLAATPPSAMVHVELKGSAIEAAVAAVIARSSATCAVHSFDHAAVARFARIAPDVPRGVLFDAATGVLAAMSAAGARDAWPSDSLIDGRLVDLVHGARGRVIAWTVNSGARAAELARLGVDGICTDDVRLVDPSFDKSFDRSLDESLTRE